MNKMILRAEVESDFVDERSGVSAKGKPYTIREQECWFYLGSKFPEKVRLSLDEAQPSYRPGLYEVDLTPALTVGDFGRLAIEGRRLKLVPVVAATAAKG